jgi:Phage capsid family
MNRHTPAPDLPERPRYFGRASTYLYRAVTALYRAEARGTALSTDIRKSDVVTPLLLKAAVTPTVLDSSPLASLAVADAIVGLAPNSAAAALIPLSMQISLAGHSGVTVPLRVITAADAGAWVAEGGPIPAAQLTLTAGPTVLPYKIAVLATLTNELADSSSAEAVISQMFSEAAALALDAKVFSADAVSTGVSPAGILNGAPTPISATAGGGVTALAGDIKKLVAALALVGGGVKPAFIMSPGLAITMKTLVGPKFDAPILATTALAATTIIAVETSSFVTAIDPVPEFRTSSETVLHSDTAATAISTVGTPNTIAAPVRSLFQTNCTAIRMILRASFAMRAANHVQIINSVTW